MATKTLQTRGILKLKSTTEDVMFDVPSGKNVVLPERTDFSACASALNAEVDLSSKQDSHAFLTQISGFNPSHGDFMRYFDSGGQEYWHLRTSGDVLDDINAQGRNARLTELASIAPSAGKLLYTTSSEVASATPNTLNILENSDIGASVQAYDAKLDDVSALSGMSNGDIVHWDGSNLVASSKSSLGIQPLATALTQISAISGAQSGQVLKYNGSTWVAGTDNNSGASYTFDAPLSESSGTVSLDESGLVHKSGDETIGGNKDHNGYISVNASNGFQHRVDANTGYITAKRDRLFKHQFNDTDAHDLFSKVYYNTDREVVLEVMITAIDTTSSPKRMHVHKFTVVTLGGSVLDTQHDIVYEPASGEVLSSAFAVTHAGNGGFNLGMTVTQPSTKVYNYAVFVSDTGILSA